MDHTQHLLQLFEDAVCIREQAIHTGTDPTPADVRVEEARTEIIKWVDYIAEG